MATNLCILGSTGSIGNSALEVIRKNRERFQVLGLSGYQNVELLAKQVREFSPKIVSVGAGNADRLKALLPDPIDCPKILEGTEGIRELIDFPNVERVVAGIAGSAGLDSAYRSVESGKTLILANKEPLVMAGELIIQTARKNKAKILPIDSEHNAVFQALQGNSAEDVENITLIASGGPFFQKPKQEFSEITLEQALKHPNWEMGKKITVDSATLMNKALEVIEARWLFDLSPEKIRVLVHPQSIIHSLVNYKDHSSIAQLGNPDMQIPISYCMSEGRLKNSAQPLDLAKIARLEFYEPDTDKFPTLSYAYDILNLPAFAAPIFNGANEALVDLFLREKIHFIDIFQGLEAIVQFLKNYRSEEIFSEGSLKIDSVRKGEKWNEFGKEKVMEYLKQ